MPGRGYRGIDKLGYVHDRRSQRAARVRGEDPGELLPAVHRIASLIKRWLLGTHQGSTDVAHLPAYMNEFVFRFNRRRSRSRGMIFYRALELAVHHRPGAVSRSDRQQAARQDAINAAERPRETSQSGAPASEPAMAGGRALLRLDG